MLAPRVLLVMPEDWPRAFLRTKLRDRGYDAVAAPSVAEALVFPVEESGRGPVRLLILDQEALEADRAGFDVLRARHWGMRVLLLAVAAGAVPPGPWAVVVRRAWGEGAVASAVEELIPLRSFVRRPSQE